MSLPAIIHSPEYARAFNLYLCKGTPIELSLKAAVQEHPTTQYIWRTRGDGKVRASHAANNGRIFSWDIPPATGHPGEDYNCRCTAEPYVRGESEYAYQTLTSAVNDSSPKWKGVDFIRHAFKDPRAVTLSEIGHLLDIINHYAYSAEEGGIFKNVNEQVIDAARKARNGYFFYDFSGSYDFKPVAYPHGESTVFGVFKGYVSEKNGLMKIDGTVEYFFDDEYTDPVRIRETFWDSSDPADASEFWRYVTDGGGAVYAITDQWQTRLHAEAKLDRNHSKYQWNENE